MALNRWSMLKTPRSRTDLPNWFIGLSLIGIATVCLPLVALLTRANWGTMPQAILSPDAVQALTLSLITATIACIICVILGVPIALVLARSLSKWINVLRCFILLPLVLPPMVGGIALLYLLGRNGMLGYYLNQAFGLRLPFSTAAVVIAQVFVALPFLVISVENSLRSQGDKLEQVAATLGAKPGRVFFTITLPLMRSGLRSGAILCFARALGEFGATAIFAGNVSGTTRTIPLAIYTAFNGSGVSQDAAIALALLLIVVAAAIMVVSADWKGKKSA